MTWELLIGNWELLIGIRRVSEEEGSRLARRRRIAKAVNASSLTRRVLIVVADWHFCNKYYSPITVDMQHTCVTIHNDCGGIARCRFFDNSVAFRRAADDHAPPFEV